MLKEKNYATLILPEARLSPEIFQELEMWLTTRYEYSEILLLCDKTATDAIKKNLQPKSDNILCLFLGGKHSTDLELRSGLEFSKGDIVFAIKDPYLPNITALLEQAAESNKKGCDAYFIGESYHKGDRNFLGIVSYFAHTRIPSLYDSAFLLTRRIINAVSQNQSRTLPLSALLRGLGYRFEEHRLSPNNARRLGRPEKNIYLMMFSDIMPRMASWACGICTLISLSAGIYASSLFFSSQKPVEGWTTTFLFLSFGFSALFGFLTVIMGYLSLLAEEIYKAPQFRVNGVVKL